MRVSTRNDSHGLPVVKAVVVVFDPTRSLDSFDGTHDALLPTTVSKTDKTQKMTRSKRSVVLENATNLFNKHGFHAVGVEAVISASGVARMTIYRNFKNKDTLIEAVLRDRSEKLLSEIGKEVLSRPTTATRIKAIFDWHQAWHQSAEFHGCLFERTLAEFPDYADAREIALNYKATLQQIIKNILVVDYPAATAEHFAMTAVILLEGATNVARARRFQQAADLAWQSMATILDAHQLSSHTLGTFTSK